MTNEEAIEDLELALATGNYIFTKSEETLRLAISALKDRPKGEWREYPEEGFVECPFCEHATNCNDDIDELHFCFYCGAELKKGGAE